MLEVTGRLTRPGACQISLYQNSTSHAYPWIHEFGHTRYPRSVTFTKKIIRTVFIDYYLKG